MRGELLRMLMALREAEPVETADIAFDVIATAEQLTYSFDAYPSASFTLDWGDGTTSTVPASQSTQSHTYSEAGTYRIRIADTTGLFSGTTRWMKPGANASSPSAAQQAAAAMVGRVYTFNTRTNTYPQFQFRDCVSMYGLELLPATTTIRESAFRNCASWNPAEMPDIITSLSGGAFLGCSSLTWARISSSLSTTGNNAFGNCTGLTELTFGGKPTSLNAGTFTGSTNLTDIYVPWSEGEVAGAPWGATNATIHYNS